MLNDDIDKLRTGDKIKLRREETKVCGVIQFVGTWSLELVGNLVLDARDWELVEHEHAYRFKYDKFYGKNVTFWAEQEGTLIEMTGQVTAVDPWHHDDPQFTIYAIGQSFTFKVVDGDETWGITENADA